MSAYDAMQLWTPRAKHVTELALREALSFGHNYIGTEHLLIALMREQGGIAYEALDALGVTTESVRQQVLRALQRRAVQKPAPTGEELRLRVENARLLEEIARLTTEDAA